MHASDQAGAARGMAILGGAIVLGDDSAPPCLPLVSHRVTSVGIEELIEAG